MHAIHKRVVMLTASSMLLLGWPTSSIGGPFIDPINDTFGAGALQPDIISIDARVSAIGLRFSVFFAGPILPASAGASNSIGGFIDIDTDQNPATGDTPFINVLGPGPDMQLGQDFFVDLFSELNHPGLVDVYKTLPDTIVGTAPAVFTPTSFSVTVALALLGPDDGLVNYDVVIGNLLEPTDVAPNGSAPATSSLVVPEPATVWLLGAAFVLMRVFRIRS